ncbi:hypothetical protein LRHMDP2_636 [Lacticaseibacillus rhamnosus LRHMDP2]|nr:hypothetical protein LRHMDP2_636 [Lacticaseibacillus rhamnosus LRHMDP2]
MQYMHSINSDYWNCKQHFGNLMTICQLRRFTGVERLSFV